MPPKKRKLYQTEIPFRTIRRNPPRGISAEVLASDLFSSAASGAANRVRRNVESTVGAALVQGATQGNIPAAIAPLLDVGTASQFALAGIPEAAAIGAGMYLVERVAESLFTQQKTEITHLMSGIYGGRLALLGKKGAKSVKQKYEKDGAVTINEVYGNVQDPDMVGVGHGSFDILNAQYVIGLALVRKLFRKAGIDLINPSAEIPFNDTTNVLANQIDLQWTMKDADGTITTGKKVIPANATLYSIVAGGADDGTGQTTANSIRQVLYEMMTVTNPKQLEMIMLNVHNNGVLLSQINLKREILIMTCHSHTIVQNRTKAASGAADAGSTSTTQVDAQPLKGIVIEFSGVPSTKSYWTEQINEANTDGTYLIRPSSFPSGSTDVEAWKEPPTKKMFNNATRVGYTRLNPGQLKDMTAVNTYRGYFQQILLKKFRTTTENNKVSSVPGKFQVVFLEEELNSGSANKISVQYETQHTLGAVFVTTKSPMMSSTYGSSVRNLNS